MTQNDAQQIDSRIREDLMKRLAKEGEHLQVKGNDGEHVGTVDHLDGDNLKLTKSDSSDGQHHYIPLSQVESMDDVAVYLNVSRDEALK